MQTLIPASVAYLPSGKPTDLAAIDISLLPPNQYAQVRVGYMGDWNYYAASALPVDNVTVVNATFGGGTLGQFVRNPAGTPGANLVTTWYVDTGAGADSNDGLTISTALLSIAEVFRRIGRQPVSQNVTINVKGNSTGSLAVDCYIEQGVTITLQGKRTVVVSDVLSARTVWAASTQTLGQYTFTTTTGSLAAYVGAAMVQVHATPTQISPVVKDLTSGAFRGLFCDTAASGAQVEPGATAAVDIYTPATISGNVTIHIRGGGYCQFNDFALATGAGGFTKVTEGGAIFQGCLVHGFSVSRPAHDVQVIASEIFDPIVVGRAELYGSTCMVGTGTNGLTVHGGGALVQVQSLSLIDGGPLSVGSGTDGRGNMQTNAPCAVADYGTTVGVTVWPDSMLRLGDYFFITKGTPAATTGYVVMDGGRIHYTTGKLIAAGGTGPTGFSTVAGTAKASGALPYVESTAGHAAIIVDV